MSRRRRGGRKGRSVVTVTVGRGSRGGRCGGGSVVGDVKGR